MPLLRPSMLFLIALLSLLLTACVHRQGGRAPAEELPRAAPAYVQWLERQSMLGAAAALTAVVSGTETLLHAPSVDTRPAAHGDRVDTLLEAADTWLFIHPPTLITAHMRPVWAELTALGDLLAALGLRGLYVAPTAESGGIWERERLHSGNGEDVTSLFFAPHMGDDGHFGEFSALALRHQWQLGADMTPTTTGLGPDFYLAARQVRDYPGTYMMLEVPEELWPRVATVSDAREGFALDAAAQAPLMETGTLPPSLARDRLEGTLPGGWAVTGEIRGSDGRLRRWVYRYHQHPRRPLLWWDDPSGSARRIISASIIRQVGILQHTLAGVRMEALMGLDPEGGSQGITAPPTLEPAPSALRDMTREVRRYGGWSVQLDALPAPYMAAAQAAGVDFTADGVTTPAAEYALLTGDAAPLRAALAASQAAGVEERRVLRRLPGVEGVDVRPLGDVHRGRLRDTLAKIPGGMVLLEDGPAPRLYATAPALAALGAGLSPHVTPAPEGTEALHRRQRLLTLFRAGLPGLFFCSGQDLAGVLALPDGPVEQRARGAWGLDAGTLAMFATRQGTPRAPVAYAPLAQQLETPGSYAAQIRHMATVRQRYGLARGRVLATARTMQPGSVAVFVRLPAMGGKSGGTLLLAANFGSVVVTEHIPLPLGVRGAVQDILEGKEQASVTGSINLTLDPLHCRWLVID